MTFKKEYSLKRHIGEAVRLVNAQEATRSVVNFVGGYVPTIIDIGGERFPPGSTVKKSRITETYSRTVDTDAMSTHEYDEVLQEIRRHIGMYVTSIQTGEAFTTVTKDHVPSECPILLPQCPEEFPHERNKLWPVWWWTIGLFDDLDWEGMEEYVAQHRTSKVVEKQILISRFVFAHQQQRDAKRIAWCNRQYFLAWFGSHLTDDGAKTIMKW